MILFLDMVDLKSKKIAVLCGGPSGEREVSLRSGKNVYESLIRQGFKAVMLDTEPDLVGSLKKEKVDVVFNMLHGKFGEDGTVQNILEKHGYPYTGSKVKASADSMDKIASKRVWQSKKIPTPKFVPIDGNAPIEKEVEKIKKDLGLPVVIKPVAEGSSLGVSIVKDEKELEPVLKDTISKFKDVFVEEFIKGQEVTVGILGTNNDLQALPVLELVPKKEFYDYEAKYTKGLTEFILPARLPKPVYEETQRIALAAHKALDCYGFSRVDIMVSEDNIPYVHDLNSIPGMTETSDLPAEAAHAGISFDELVAKILKSAY